MMPALWRKSERWGEDKSDVRGEANLPTNDDGQFSHVELHELVGKAFDFVENFALADEFGDWKGEESQWTSLTQQLEDSRW
jgi:hypothetical protein